MSSLLSRLFPPATIASAVYSGNISALTTLLSAHRLPPDAELEARVWNIDDREGKCFKQFAVECPYVEALLLAAKAPQPTVFDHLIDVYPQLTKTFKSHIMIYAALDGESVPVWRTILKYRPGAKDFRYGHSKNIVESCIGFAGHQRAKLLTFLLDQGAKVEEEDRPVMLQAEIYEASDEIKDILRKHGAREISPQEWDEIAELRRSGP